MSAQVWVQAAGGAVSFLGAVLATPDAFEPEKIERAREGIKSAAEAVQRLVSKEHLKGFLKAAALGLVALWVMVYVFFLVSLTVVEAILVVAGLGVAGMTVGASVVWLLSKALFWLSRLFEAGTHDKKAFLRVGGKFIAVGFVVFLVGTIWPFGSASTPTTPHSGFIQPLR